MANPLTRDASATNFSSKSNLESLNDGQAKPLGDVNCSSEVYYDAEVAPIKIQTVASGNWTTGDTCSLYLIHTTTSLTTANDWTDGIDPDSTSDVASSLNGALHVQTIKTEADNTSYWFDGFSVRRYLGFVPFGWTVVVKNGGANAAAHLHATGTNFIARYKLVKFA